MKESSEKSNNQDSIKNSQKSKVGVVIPCYKVKKSIISVIETISRDVSMIVIVDDGCPEESGKEVLQNVKDQRVHVIHHEKNMGVGAAVKSGYRFLLSNNFEIAVKIDGDGQMDPSKILNLVNPLIMNEADYAKGNRFAHKEALRRMPLIRLAGNYALSYISKLSTGYWHINDPNNGFTAIKLDILNKMDLDKVSDTYFFESDMLFRLALADARAIDIDIPAIYADEVSNLSVARSLFEFTLKHLRNFIHRMVRKVTNL